ncbi:MAG TPA: hypothetical protein VFG76_06975 [Candidatus Polarisedimenticolia bacterium]|nr:hypothetical protein [Candidatus Polarisedimenticolia bacterium]
MPRRLHPGIGAAILLLAAPLQAAPQVLPFDLRRPPVVAQGPSRGALLASLASSESLTLIVLSADPNAMEGYLSIARTSDQERGRPSIKVVAAASATMADVSGPFILAGSIPAVGGEPPPVMLRYLGATAYPAGDLPAANETLRVTGRNPWRPGSAMILVTGRSDAAIQEYLGRPWSIRQHDYELMRGDLRVRHGRFAWDDDGRAAFDGSRDTDARSDLASITSGEWTFSYFKRDLTEPVARVAAADISRRLAGFLVRLDAPRGPVAPAIHVVLHSERETKALRTDDPRLSHLSVSPDSSMTVHVVVSSSGAPRDSFALALAAVHRMGRPSTDAVSTTLQEGAAAFLAGEFLGRELDWWGPRLLRSGLLLGPSTLLETPRSDDAPSYLVRVPSAGLLARWLSRSSKPGLLGEALRDPKALGFLAGEGAASQRAAFVETVSRIAAASGAPGRGIPGAFQRGVTLAHEGYGVVDGYGSKASVESLEQIKRLGADSVAISPYGFMQDPSSHRIVFHRDEHQWAGSENDPAVLATISEAHRLGLRVMLKPQIWLSRGHWSGEVAMTDEAAWSLFFADYERFLAHYALLAAVGDADLLVVGVEMQEATRAKPDRWRDLIRMTRKLYDGPLTYAANWGDEFERVLFWGDLDYVGLDCYYPLSPDAAATDEQILRGARSVVERIESVGRKAGRPVLITEIGFPALASPWMAPHDEETGRAEEEAGQARSYAAVLEALWSARGLAGLYWWKWPTTPPGGRTDPLFSPRGRAAQRVLEHWFRAAPAVSRDWPSK